MENAEGPSAGSDNSVQASSWKGLRDAARFWEPRRPLYNLLLFAVVVLWVVGTLLAILFENYWIADEIYPFVQHP